MYPHINKISHLKCNKDLYLSRKRCILSVFKRKARNEVQKKIWVRIFENQNMMEAYLWIKLRNICATSQRLESPRQKCRRNCAWSNCGLLEVGLNNSKSSCSKGETFLYSPFERRSESSLRRGIALTRCQFKKSIETYPKDSF